MSKNASRHIHDALPRLFERDQGDGIEQNERNASGDFVLVFVLVYIGQFEAFEVEIKFLPGKQPLVEVCPNSQIECSWNWATQLELKTGLGLLS
jgi:hypothetical protein